MDNLSPPTLAPLSYRASRIKRKESLWIQITSWCLSNPWPFANHWIQADAVEESQCTGSATLPRAWYTGGGGSYLAALNNVYRHPLDACLFLVFDPSSRRLSFYHQFPRKILKLHRLERLVATCLASMYIYTWSFGMWRRQQWRSTWRWRNSYTSSSVSGCGKRPTTFSTVAVRFHKEWRRQVSSSNRPTTSTNRNQFPCHQRGRQMAMHRCPRRKPHSFRALIGALQWPCTQSSPYLTMLSFPVGWKSFKSNWSATIDHGNKILQDGQGEQWRHFAVFSTWVTSVTSHSSHMLMLRTPIMMTSLLREATCFAWSTELPAGGDEGKYNLIDWRSWKLARVARSSFVGRKSSYRRSSWLPFFSPACFGGWSSILSLTHWPRHLSTPSASTSSCGWC